jgi:ABC-type multidrug transport system ATPase subunit
MAQAVINEDIQIKNVFKRFGDFEALKDVSLSVNAG